MGLRELLIEAAKIASGVHKKVLENGVLDIQYKSANKNDAVTIADKESEKALRAFYVQHLPDHNIFGEEQGAAYNGNGKIIVLDPLDGTTCFSKSTKEKVYPGFGVINGIYEDGRNIASVVYNTMRDVMYVASEHGFEKFGEEKPQQNVIFISGSSSMPIHPDFNSDVERLLQEAFPDNPVVVLKSGQFAIQDCLNHSRPCDKVWAAYFHAGLAWHDISHLPLFGELTGTKITDHNGVPMGNFDPWKELRKYQVGTHTSLYSHPTLVAQPQYHEEMLRIFERFKTELDKKQNPVL